MNALTSKQGTEYAARVARLLRSSTGCKNVREQQHIRRKNINIIFQEQWNTHKYLTIAGECEHWRTGVDREAVKSIDFDHEPLIDTGDVDDIGIITPGPVAAAVQEHIDGFVGVEILHLSKLELGKSGASVSA